MYAILAEDDSDAEVLTAIVRRHFQNDRLTIKKKGYDGCGGLCAKGARDIKTWAAAGIHRFIVCHDADAHPPAEIRRKVFDKVVNRSGQKDCCCITVPVEEIEAWLIADETAINHVIPSFKFAGHRQPETIPNPKEWLVAESIARNGKPRYSPKTFNEKVATHLRLDVVAKKCPSFQTFIECLNQWAA